MAEIALSELLGMPVVDSNGARYGKVREVIISPQENPSKISGVIIRTSEGDRILTAEKFAGLDDLALKCTTKALSELAATPTSDGFLMLERDLLDQQIIDINGRKVVRVNDVTLREHGGSGDFSLTVSGVETGPRGAVRRLLKGVAPRPVVQALVEKMPARVIPWEFVDLIETDPARRVKLKIAHHRLARLHPADIADILEDLAPAERGAIFETLDQHIAADALEEITPKMQVSIVESLDSDRAADIVEEMDPDAAADLLADLSEERSQEILGEMRPAERKEISDLLEFHEDTAAGRMTTEFLAVPPNATVEEAIDKLRNFQGGIETVNTIYVVDENRVLIGSVPLAILAVVPHDAQMAALTRERPITCHLDTDEKEYAGLFDKYNLLALPVVDDSLRLCGVITADDVISLLYRKL